MSEREENKLVDYFYKCISKKYSRKHIKVAVKEALKDYQPNKIKVALENFANSPFWRKYSSRSPEWIFNKDRIKRLIDITLGINLTGSHEVSKNIDLFTKYYNSFILHDFQEEFRMIPFIKKGDFSDNLKGAVCFFDLNREKMYNIIGEEICNDRLMFIFVGILFYVFEDPPHIFQYFKDEDKYWEFFEDCNEHLYSLYDNWEGWNWLDPPVELKMSSEGVETQRFYEKQEENRKDEKCANKMNNMFYDIFKKEK